MSNVIYAYKKNSNNQIVYVGQTQNLKERHYRHIKIDPYKEELKEYNYPLSRGIRKYGENEYKLIILEDNLLKDELDKKEKYWIEYYNTYWNGYNQSKGGKNPIKPIFEEEKIDIVIEMLKDESYSYKDIIGKTGISLTHIYNINIGKRRRKDNINYPIRKSNTKGTKGLKFSPEENLLIHKTILNTHKTYKQIARDFECDATTIRRINEGKTKKYRLDNFDYPLRNK